MTYPLGFFCQAPQEGALVAFFSARLDETGTDGRSDYCVVAGAVAVPEQWDALERKWDHLLARSGVSAFHTKEYLDRKGDFEGWTDFKWKRFAEAQKKIIRQNTAFDIAVGVERLAHSQIKKDMRGIRGFKADSDYGMAFRIAMLRTCWFIRESYPRAKVGFIVEDGPFSADASLIW